MTETRRSSAHEHGTGRLILMVTTSEALVYLLAAITGINQWPWMFLKDHYRYYAIVYVISLWCLLVAMCFLKAVRERPFVLFPFGLVAGYVAGLMAFFFMPLLMPHGLERFLRLPRLEDWLVILMEPLLCLSWLLGGLTTAVVVAIDFMARARPRPSSSAA